MNRTELQKLSKLRIKEAKVLLDNDCFEGSYYLAGYAIECAIKACIAKQTRRYDFPPDRKAIEQIYKHAPEGLMKAASLWTTFESAMRIDIKLNANWQKVAVWSEVSRYDLGITDIMARELYQAVTARNHGVLLWLKRYW